MNLSRQVRDFAAKQKFTIGEVLATGHCSTVYRDGDRVLKVPTTSDEQSVSVEVLRELARVGGPGVLAHDLQTGAQILEYVPGARNLTGESETVSRLTFMELARKIAVCDPWAAKPLNEYYAVIPPGFEWLLESGPTTFLHGDLHHENILYDKATKKWRPIDPKGLRGDPAFEAVAFLRNPILEIPTRSDLVELTLERIHLFSQELGYVPIRQAAWLYVDRWEALREEPRDSPWHTALPKFKEIYEIIVAQAS